MGKTSIEWCDFTFNPWWGCTKVSPGCDHCYAETLAKRTGHDVWGAGKPRRFFKYEHWEAPSKWNAKAEREGVRRKVFCLSMGDVFDNEVDPGHRADLIGLIQTTPHLDWLLLTKRIGNAAKMLPSWWGAGLPNVWLGISVVNQEEADRDIPKLVATAARTKFLSCEPLLGPVTLNVANVEDPDEADRYVPPLALLDWIIVGGESGPGARPMQIEWALSILAECRMAGAACFIKQLGADPRLGSAQYPAERRMGGWDRKGGDPYFWPEALRVREFPPVTNSQQVKR